MVVFVALLLDNMLLTVVGTASGSRCALREPPRGLSSSVGLWLMPQGPCAGRAVGRAGSFQDTDIWPAPFSSAVC